MSLTMEKFNINKFRDKVNERLYPLGIQLESLIKDNSISEEKKERWISLFETEDQADARLMIDSIIHVGWSTFRHNLLKMAQEIREKINGEQYGFFSSSSKNKSDSFFTAIVYEEIFRDNNEPIFCSNGNLDDFSNIVYVDDMSYSGSQLYDLFGRILFDMKYPKIYSTMSHEFVIPVVMCDESEANIILKTMEQNSFVVIITTVSNIRYMRLTSNGSKIINKKYDGYEVGKLLKDINSLGRDVRNIAQYLNYETGYMDVSENEITRISRGKNFFFCIPYLSVTSLEKIKKLRSTYNVNIYAIDNMYQKNSREHREQIINFEKLIMSSNSETYKKMIILYTMFSSGDYTENIIQYLLSESDEEIEIYRLLPQNIYFDHKLASPISTIAASVIGCGFVLSPTKIIKWLRDKGCRIEQRQKYGGTFTVGNCSLKEMPYFSTGNLMQNCRDVSNLQCADRFIENLYYDMRPYDPDRDESCCILCPKPVYKLTNEEIYPYIMNILL